MPSCVDGDVDDDKSRRLRLMRELEDIVRKEQQGNRSDTGICPPISNYGRSRV